MQLTHESLWNSLFEKVWWHSIPPLLDKVLQVPLPASLRAVLSRNAATVLFPFTMGVPRGFCPHHSMVSGFQAAVNSPHDLFVHLKSCWSRRMFYNFHSPLSLAYHWLEPQAKVLWTNIPLYECCFLVLTHFRALLKWKVVKISSCGERESVAPCLCSNVVSLKNLSTTLSAIIKQKCVSRSEHVLAFLSVGAGGVCCGQPGKKIRIMNLYRTFPLENPAKGACLVSWEMLVSPCLGNAFKRKGKLGQ